MSRATPPQPTPGAPKPQQPSRAGATGQPTAQRAGATGPGMPAQKPGVTTPKAPAVGASAPPNKAGQPATASGNGAAAAGPAPAPVQGIPPIDQLQGRPIGRVLTKMGKVNREQVVEALDFQKRKGGALGRILIDLG